MAFVKTCTMIEIDDSLKSNYPEIWGAFWLGDCCIMYRCLCFNSSLSIILN